MRCRLFRRFQAINRTTNASSVKNCNFVCLFFERGIDAAYLALFHRGLKKYPTQGRVFFKSNAIKSVGVTKMVKTIYGDQVPVRGLNDRYLDAQ